MTKKTLMTNMKMKKTQRHGCTSNVRSVAARQNKASEKITLTRFCGLVWKE